METETVLDLSMEESVIIHMPYRKGLKHPLLEYSQLRYLRSPLSQDQILLALVGQYVASMCHLVYR